MSKETVTKLAGSEKELDMESLYLIDFTKINSVNDLVLILASIGFTFSPYHPHFDQLKPFLNLDTPIPNQRPIQPEAKEVKLPKLKNIKK
jgi:hypothetical protein